MAKRLFDPTDGKVKPQNELLPPSTIREYPHTHTHTQRSPLSLCSHTRSRPVPRSYHTHMVSFRQCQHRERPNANPITRDVYYSLIDLARPQCLLGGATCLTLLSSAQQLQHLAARVHAHASVSCMNMLQRLLWARFNAGRCLVLLGACVAPHQTRCEHILRIGLLCEICQPCHARPRHTIPCRVTRWPKVLYIARLSHDQLLV
jgi:hypothetical protein